MVVKKVIFRSEKRRIPIFAVLYYDNGAEPDLEFYNRKTKSLERMSYSRFIRVLTSFVFGGILTQN